MKTQTCAFSAFKIYPGRGIKFVKSDNRSFVFFSRKTRAAFLMKRNPRRCPWTAVYRSLRRKGKDEEVIRKRTRRTHKMEKAIEGATLDDIRAKRSQKPEVRAAAREAALREIKQHKKAMLLKKQEKAGIKPAAAKPAAKKPAAKAQAPKVKAAPVKNVAKGQPKGQPKGR